MDTRPSGKKLIAAFGIAVGAGIALTFSYRGNSKKRRIQHTAKIDPKRTPVTASSSRSLFPADVLNSGTIRHVQEALTPPAAGMGGLSRERRVPMSGASSPEPGVLSRGVDVPPSACPAPADLPVTQRFGGAVIDALIILLACCIFVGISPAFRVSVGIGRFELVILFCSVVLIATFYGFLFQISGGGTAGQTWLKVRLNQSGHASVGHAVVAAAVLTRI